MRRAAIALVFGLTSGLAGCGRVPLDQGALPVAPSGLAEDAGAPDAAEAPAGETPDAPAESAPDAPADAPPDALADARPDEEPCPARGKRCFDETHAQFCRPDGTWSKPSTCVNGCERDACQNPCRPGGTRCVSPDEVQTCADNRVWGPRAVCPAGCAGQSCRTAGDDDARPEG